MAANSEAILNHRYLEMVKLLNVYLNHFPKHEKYALANIIRNTANTIHNERTGILVGSGNPGAKVRIFNNIIYDGSRNSASSTDAGIYTEDLDVTVYAYNNTISNFTRGFQINGGSGKIIAKNNIDCISICNYSTHVFYLFI